MSTTAPSSPSGSSQAQAPSSSNGTSPRSSSSSPPPVSSTDNSSTHSLASSSGSGQDTTSQVTTPTPTTTPTTPTTTTQSSPEQTTSTAAKTTAPSSVASASSASSTALTTTSASSFTTDIVSTLSSTDPAGSIVYVTTEVPQIVTTSVSVSTGGSSSNSHTGVIVGAVVGGVAGITLLALLLFCIRRRVRNDEFDGNFDPDRVVGHDDGGGGTLPNVDLADEVSPFPQTYTDQGNSSMRQYGDSYHPIPSSFTGSGPASGEFYQPGAPSVGGSGFDSQARPFVHPAKGPLPSGAYLPPVNMYGTGPVDWHTPVPGGSPPPSTVSHTTSSGRAAKEREAIGRGGQGTGLGLATQPEAAEGSGDVVVHQDAGRAPIEEHVPPREIPPAYESIRQD